MKKHSLFLLFLVGALSSCVATTTESEQPLVSSSEGTAQSEESSAPVPQTPLDRFLSMTSSDCIVRLSGEYLKWNNGSNDTAKVEATAWYLRDERDVYAYDAKLEEVTQYGDTYFLRTLGETFFEDDDGYYYSESLSANNEVLTADYSQSFYKIGYNPLGYLRKADFNEDGTLNPSSFWRVFVSLIEPWETYENGALIELLEDVSFEISMPPSYSFKENGILISFETYGRDPTTQDGEGTWSLEASFPGDIGINHLNPLGKLEEHDVLKESITALNVSPFTMSIVDNYRQPWKYHKGEQAAYLEYLGDKEEYPNSNFLFAPSEDGIEIYEEEEDGTFSYYDLADSDYLMNQPDTIAYEIFVLTEPGRFALNENVENRGELTEIVLALFPKVIAYRFPQTSSNMSIELNEDGSLAKIDTNGVTFAFSPFEGLPEGVDDGPYVPPESEEGTPVASKEGI